MWMRPGLFVSLPLLLHSVASAQARPAAANAASRRGETLYLSQCSICHGQQGEGGRGTPLARAKLRRAPDEDALVRVIRRGIADTDMPPSSLDESELRLIAAYVRKLGRDIKETFPAGDPQRGLAIYRSAKAGCANCHTIEGRGGAFGPDLTSIGDRRSAMHLRESIVKPDAAIPPGYFEIRAMTTAGSTVSGVRVNEDTFSIQLRDASGKVHSFWKSELQSLAKDMTKSPMPNYGSAFTTSELDDLVAYLARLREVAK